ncbi:glutamate transport system substrate-binding protein [Arthrobacter sp. yr096]|uniref:glutamate ABC transporter substrate-binding protein n=1 Tax=Arthrobacter sp. yr096 TaxID=1761750 RepID=UPI0008BA3D97|nr:glutamate ABC transporter substrate-binding protein [Arthrobacter sp. yr096]SEJ78171.1 glutamate transport system substrate-binding protein [Arthrobacter sp. yr096]
MRNNIVLAALAATSAAVLALCGCSGSNVENSSTASSAPAYQVATGVTLDDSPTFKKATSRGSIVIGVKEDQPGLGYLDVVTGERTGFDIEIARWTAATLGFSGDKITYKAIPSVAREQALSNGDVDIYVGTYSITDKRKQQVDFAGPYFQTGQSLLVKADNNKISSKENLVAGVTVCSVTGSTPIQNIRTNFPAVKTTEFDTYSQCVEALKSGQVDAVTSDQALLLGFASQDSENLKVVGEPFSKELYGLGLPKGDSALRARINKMFTDGGATWKSIYDSTLGKSGTSVEQPAVDSY